MKTSIALLLRLPLLAAGATAYAQSGAAPAASRATFMTLMKVQEFWEEERYDQAIAELEELLRDTEDDPYEFGLTSQYLAHTNILMDRPDVARRILEAALQKEGMYFQLRADLKLFLGQLVLGDEDFELSYRLLTEWLAETQEVPNPTQLFSAAYANYMTDHFRTAEELIVRAIEGSKRAPPDAWHRLHYVKARSKPLLLVRIELPAMATPRTKLAPTVWPFRRSNTGCPSTSLHPAQRST